MNVASATLADLAGKIDRKRTDHDIARLNALDIQMVYHMIDLDALSLGPFSGTRMSGDKIGCHPDFPTLDEGMDFGFFE